MTDSLCTPAVTVSIIIKALNEADNIAATLQHALQALAGLNGMQGEVILADSGSTDGTVDIARRYPVTIVQLAKPTERCCGIGPQLGYQAARGQWLWLMDGDMLAQAGFLPAALATLQADSRLAGVGGPVLEKNLQSLEFQARVQRDPHKLQAGMVDRLDGGGVYRRSAIEAVGYLSNRNLHAYEEFELGVRLRAAGWRLERLSTPAVAHYGHTRNAYALLLQRWRSGYMQGIGELLRASIGQPHLPLVLRDVRELRVYSAVIVWWLLLTALLLTAPLAAAAVLAAPFAAMSLKKKSLRMGVYAVVAWQFYSAALLGGLLRRQTDPRQAVASITLHTPDMLRAQP